MVTVSSTTSCGSCIIARDVALLGLCSCTDGHAGNRWITSSRRRLQETGLDRRAGEGGQREDHDSFEGLDYCCSSFPKSPLQTCGDNTQ
ncbi:hypothetical protein EYF80_013444 [Liparis tanakae]|uniref:Uncharacterized protein n=1 Tax=Liparis tanakae TaxID=230148 RepID=A0A4Z2IFI6_9TELE|nr:hypothetical protein EYF80_013444 [Liparis tanakae]